MVYRNTYHIIWYNITILWYGNIAILYCTQLTINLQYLLSACGGFLSSPKSVARGALQKRFFPTVSIRSESVRNDFSEKVFVKIKMIHISILSYSLYLVRKHLKRFLEKVFVKITQFRVCPSSFLIDYTLLLGARRSCGQFFSPRSTWAGPYRTLAQIGGNRVKFW